jgi:hypothetical protein
MRGTAICYYPSSGTLVAFLFVTVLVPLAKDFSRRSGLMIDSTQFRTSVSLHDA